MMKIDFIWLLLFTLSTALVAGYEDPPYFQFYEDQLGADFMKRCQYRSEPPMEGQSGCRKKPKACMWGSQACPDGANRGGLVQPTTRCTCYDNSWMCQPFQCATIDPQCPSVDPSMLTPSPVCSADLNCGYEDQFCCGRRFAKKFCTCKTGTLFQCDEINICDASTDCSTIDNDLAVLLELRVKMFRVSPVATTPPTAAPPAPTGSPVTPTLKPAVPPTLKPAAAPTDGSCGVSDYQGECAYTGQCKTMYPTAYDCKNHMGGVCYCGNTEVCGCLGGSTSTPPSPTVPPTFPLTPPPTAPPTPLPTPPPTTPPSPPPTAPPTSPPTSPPTLPPTPAPILPPDFILPSGPYISAATANERVVIPDPPQPPNLPRTNCPHHDAGLLDWHNPSTWAPGSMPVAGNDVTLPSNSRVIVSQTVEGTLGIVTVPSSSQLIFDENNSGISFRAHGIDVLGKLVIGSETCRVETPVTITLHGNRPSDPVANIPAEVHKGISVTGEISVHGKRFYRTWTRLALTVEPGDNILMLQNNVNWEPGQEIVLVTTAMKDSREWHRNEIAIVQSVIVSPVAGVGAAVILQSPVSYQHLAIGSYQGEVGLLTRLVKIQGDLASEPTDPDPLNCRYGTTDGPNRSLWGSDKGRPCPNTELTGYGGHVMVHKGGKGYVEGVELYRMGQTNVLGRYPMHFHVLSDKCQDCYFRDSSVHRSFYRCVSIHGTHYTTVSENVAYDVSGFCYYLEDGVEHYNRIEFNLGAHIHMIGPEPPYDSGQNAGVYVQSSTLTLPADVAAAPFYITNVQNYIIGNAASGGWSGFAFPNLPEPLGPHRGMLFRPSSAQGLTIDGNTAHSSSWWWPNAGAFYLGGTLEYVDDTLTYIAGRDKTVHRDTCLVDKCQTTGKCGNFCSPHEYAWLQVSNSKAFLAPGVGFSAWSGRLEVLGYECHDCGLSLNSISRGFWMTNLLSVCRTLTPIVLPSGARASNIRGDGFRWYDTGQEHIITDATFRNCGYRSNKNEYDQYNQDPTRGCSNDPAIGCHSRSSAWALKTFSDSSVPEVMQGTRAITFENCGRRFREDDFRGVKPSTGSGREGNWIDADGSVTGFGESSVIASGQTDAGLWWQVDNEVVYEPQGPQWFFKLTGGPERGLGHIRMRWDKDLHDQIRKTVCGNGNNLPCPAVGHLSHVGDRFSGDEGLPVTAAADIAGPVGGFAWKLELDGGAPKSMRMDQIEVDPATPLLISIAYPIGTSFTIVYHAHRCQESAEYSCKETFHEVGSVAAVRSSLGNTYHVDSQGILTFRVIQFPEEFTGRPEFFTPQWSDVGKFGQGYAITRFERDGVRLPKHTHRNVMTLDADCVSSGAYCSQAVASYNPKVCPAGYIQTGYDACTSTLNPSIKKFANGGSSTS